MKFRPLHDRVAVRRVDSETKTSGGIIIPDTAAEKPQQGEIIAAGPGARDESGKLVPLDVKKGDKVLFGKWSGTEVKIDGDEVLIMKESDIMIVVGGVIPPADHDALFKAGAKAVFGPGTNIPVAAADLLAKLNAEMGYSPKAAAE